MPKNKIVYKTPGYAKFAIFTLAIVNLYFGYWLVNTYRDDVSFRNYVNSTYGFWFNDLLMLVIGAAGLSFCTAWTIFTYMRDRKEEPVSTKTPMLPAPLPILAVPPLPAVALETPKPVALPPKAKNAFEVLAASSPTEMEKRIVTARPQASSNPS